MRFEFATATRIVFGPGQISKIGSLAADMGKRALIAVGGSNESDATNRAAPLVDFLAKSGVESVTYLVSHEPTVDVARQGLKLATECACDLVIGFGGGSSVDTGKAVAALLTNPGDIYDYLEVIGKGKSLSNPSAPFIAIPTTSGTGAEVTRNAVLGAPEKSVKVSLRSPYMLPRVALVDPELTHSMPPAVTASTGLDALTQLIEPYVSNQSNPMADALSKEGMPRAARSLQRAYENGSDAQAREDMSLASLFGGLALANAKLGAVHGIAAPFGGMFPAPHGATCARLLPFVMEINHRSLKKRMPDSVYLQRYQDVAQILTGNPKATIQDGVQWVFDVCSALHVPGLGSYGFTEKDFPDLIQKSSVASSMQGNPIKLLPEELEEIFQRAL
jgi:alcohol dehydrogenase class IV